MSEIGAILSFAIKEYIPSVAEREEEKFEILNRISREGNLEVKLIFERSS